MNQIRIQTSTKAVPMIYAYTTPEIKRHEGWTKIGYTERDVDTRVKEQSHTADVEVNLEWKGTAIFDDGSGDTFRDTDFHAYLKALGVEQEEGKNNEWFHITPLESHGRFYEFKANRGKAALPRTVVSYKLRKEQNDAIEHTVDYFNSHEGGEFLWNAKPRFGKTLSVYDLCKRMGLTKILIVTNRPAIANSWYEDFVKFMGDESGLTFVSDTSSLENKIGVQTWDKFSHNQEIETLDKFILFLSLQHLKGSKYFNGDIEKLKYVRDIKWDILVIDEAHEGVDTYKTDVAFNQISRRWTLHLSGTPFKAIANEKFPSEAIYNWTYADEQRAKAEWNDSDGAENPYESLPRLSLFTYQMSEIVRDKAESGIVIDGNTEDYAFDLNEFFAVGSKNRFIHEEAVDKFLDALTTNEKYPFSTPELRNELRHTLWLLKRVDSARALARKLEQHPVFKDYKIVLAAGDRTINDETETEKSYNRVRKAISENEYTITLSVSQLTTGVTIPEWSAVLMLSNIHSPALYMQAAFRAQNPCLYRSGGVYYRKKNAYVFDFDPARTLTIFEKFANDLSSDTGAGRGDSDSRKKHVRELLNFFPVIGEDENGKMIELDAEKVLSIPRRIRSVEVVRHGFISNLLFQNISNIFAAPAVADLIKKMAPTKEDFVVPDESELDLGDDGEISIPKEKVIGTATDVFGEKIYSDKEALDELLQRAEDVATSDSSDSKSIEMKKLLDRFDTKVTQEMLNTANDRYGNKLTTSARKSLEKKINRLAEREINLTLDGYNNQQKTTEREKEEELDASSSNAERLAIQKKYEEIERGQKEKFLEDVKSTLSGVCEEAACDIVEKIMTDEQNAIKNEVEDNIRDHLRGFSRTIPSFLMAYGSENDITLANFDQIIPENVFEEVTSITLDEFRFLRDGGDIPDEETGEIKHFDGKLFDEIVFNDSVKEFMSVKKRLANYFDDSAKGDIFDYIPPQQTNQIFTPRATVVRMVDMLEIENPGCFDDDSKTFADLYLKSGMYLAEIVKRLYRSEKMKELYPDKKERLNHIFAKQIYGMAPTEIIYRIVLSYVLGFSDQIEIERHNIVLCDSLQYAKDGTLNTKLEELYGDRLH